MRSLWLLGGPPGPRSRSHTHSLQYVITRDCTKKGGLDDRLFLLMRCFYFTSQMSLVSRSSAKL